MKQICVLFASITFAAMLSSCSSHAPRMDAFPYTWKMYQGDVTHNAVLQESTLRVSWNRRLDDRVNAGLAFAHGRVFVDSFDHYLYALDIASGDLLWRRDTGNIAMSTPVVSHNIVVVGTGHNGFLRPEDASSLVWGRPEGDRVLAYAADTGRLLWSFKTVGEDMPSAAIEGHEVIFANGDLHAYALDLQTGKVLWRRDLPGIVSMASMMVHHSLAITSACRNAPHRCWTIAFNVHTGLTKWQSQEGGSDAAPAVDRGKVFVSGSSVGSSRYRPGGRDNVACLDERNGKTLWKYVGPDSPFTMLASDEHEITGTAVGGLLYQSINNADEVVAFDERDGRILWTVHAVSPIKMSPIVSSSRVYFGDLSGLIYSVDRQTGKIVTTSAMKQPFSTSPFVLIGQTLFVVNGSDIDAIPVDLLR